MNDKQALSARVKAAFEGCYEGPRAAALSGVPVSTVYLWARTGIVTTQVAAALHRNIADVEKIAALYPGFDASIFEEAIELEFALVGCPQTFARVLGGVGFMLFVWWGGPSGGLSRL